MLGKKGGKRKYCAGVLLFLPFIIKALSYPVAALKNVLVVFFISQCAKCFQFVKGLDCRKAS